MLTMIILIVIFTATIVGGIKMGTALIAEIELLQELKMKEKKREQEIEEALAFIRKIEEKKQKRA